MSHVTGLFTRRGFNIDSIAVGVTHDKNISNITIVLRGDQQTLDQFRNQLLKLPDVLNVNTLPFHGSVIRELLLIRVNASSQDRPEIFGIVEVFGGKPVEITEESILIEVSGNQRYINGIIKMLNKFGIIEMARTGQVALSLHSDED